MSGLKRRLSALEVAGGGDFVPWCRVIAERGESEDDAMARHVAAGECRPNGGHFIIQFVSPQSRHMGARQ